MLSPAITKVDQMACPTHPRAPAIDSYPSPFIGPTSSSRTPFSKIDRILFRHPRRRCSEDHESLHRHEAWLSRTDKHWASKLADSHTPKHSRSQSDGGSCLEDAFRLTSLDKTHPKNFDVTSVVEDHPHCQSMHDQHMNIHAHPQRPDYTIVLSAGYQSTHCSCQGYDGSCDSNPTSSSSPDGRTLAESSTVPSIAQINTACSQTDKDAWPGQPLPDAPGPDAKASSGEAKSEELTIFTDPFASDSDKSRKVSATSDSTTYYLRPNAFAGHRDTFARIVHSHLFQGYDEDATIRSLSHDTIPTRRPSAYAAIPPAIIELVLRYLSFSDYKVMRLVSRQWYRDLPEPHFPAIYRLPRELVQEIMFHLLPGDYDSARHTCASWCFSGQDRRLQQRMLKLGGCKSAFEEDLRLHFSATREKACSADLLGTHREATDPSCLDQEWICGKRLATESRLSSYWRGRNTKHSNSLPKVLLTETVDFSKLLSSAPNEAHRAKFTVSACGKFVLVNSGSDISIFSLCDREDTLKPIVRLAAGIEVLKVSMDTSSERYAVAALLAGRKGMLWELLGDMTQARYRSNFGEPISLGMQADVQSSALGPVSRDIALNLSMRSAEYHAVVAFQRVLADSNVGGDSPSPPVLPNPPSY